MIELESISKTYNKGKSNEVKALREISLRVEDGEMLAVTGPSGSGKSTLLYILSFLEEAESGTYRLFGEDTGKLSERKKAALRNGSIGFVMQDYGLIPSLSAYKNVEIPLLIAGGLLDAAIDRRVERLERAWDDLVRRRLSPGESGDA